VLLTNLVMYTTLLTVPFFVVEVQHRGVATSGVLLGVMSVLMTLTAPVSGWISDRVGRRTPALAGSVILVIGTSLLVVVLSVEVSVWALALALAVIGTGVGISVAAASTAAIEAAPLALAGVASGTNSMMRYLGSIVGAGVLAAVLSTEGGVAPSIGSFRLIVLVVTVVSLGSIPVAAALHRLPASRTALTALPTP
jgi:MFS family permease